MALRRVLQLAAGAARSALLGGNLASLSLLGRPRRYVAYANEALFQYRLAASRGLPRRPIHDAFPGHEAEVRLGNLHGYTWLHSETPPFAVDLVSLCLLCRGIAPRVIFEIGTFIGYTALHMALNTPDGSRIFTLDLPAGDARTTLRTTASDTKVIDKRTQAPVFAGHAAAGKIERLFGDSATFDFSAWHGEVDLFLIDGAHSYDYVRSDTLNALRCCRPGSVIVWHDYGRVEHRGVTRWLHEFARQREVYVVPNGSLAYHVLP